MNVIPTNYMVFELVKNPDLEVEIVPSPIIASYQSHPIYTYKIGDELHYTKSTLDVEGKETVHYIKYDVQDIRHEVVELGEANVCEQRMVIYLFPLEVS